MKKRILLIDESLTVQKVVALTLDKGSYQVLYARNRQEVIKTVVDQPIDLILLSENVTGITWQSFPKELESWLGKTAGIPQVILVTGQDIREAKHFAAVLKKPFSPNHLLEAVDSLLAEAFDHEPTGSSDRQLLPEDTLQAAFNRRFADENELVRQTFEEEDQNPEPNNDISMETQEQITPVNRAPSRNAKVVPISASDLWSAQSSDFNSETEIPGTPKEKTEELWGTQSHKQMPSPTPEKSNMKQQENAVLTAEDSLAYKAFLETEVKSKIQDHDLEAMVKKALEEMMPPIVEKLVQERLDHLLKDHEESLAS